MIRNLIIFVMTMCFSFGNCAFAQEVQSSIDETVPVQTKMHQQNQQQNQIHVVSPIKNAKSPICKKPTQKCVFPEKKIIKKTPVTEIGKIPLSAKIKPNLYVEPKTSASREVAKNTIENVQTPESKIKSLDHISDQIRADVPNVKVPEPLSAEALAEIQEYKRISLQDAINYALSHNLDIKGNRLNLDISKNKIKEANRLQNPSMLSFFNLGKAATDNPNTVGLLFPFEIAKRGARKNYAKAGLELTKGNVKYAELNLRLDVRTEYINLIAAKSVLKILDDHRKLLQELLNIAQRKYQVGVSPQMDVIQAKMTLNQHLIFVNTATTNVLVARYNFNKILNSRGLDTDEDYLLNQKEFKELLTPTPEERLMEFEQLAQIALEKRLDLKIARQDVEVAKKNLIVVMRQRVPDIEIGSGYMFVPPALATSGNLAQGAFLMGNITNIPLLYQYTPEIKNAKLQLEQKQLAYESLKNQAMMNLHSAYDQFNTAQANLNYYSDILLTESQQFLKMAIRSYEVGKTGITDLIFMQQSYKNILMGYTSALSEYYNAWINLLREVNDEDLKLNG